MVFLWFSYGFPEGNPPSIPWLLQQHVRQGRLDQLPQGALQRAHQGVKGGQVEVHVAVPHDVPQGERWEVRKMGRTVGKARLSGWNMEKTCRKIMENWEILVILGECTQKQRDLYLMYGVDWGWDGSFMVNGDLPQQRWWWMGISQLIG